MWIRIQIWIRIRNTDLHSECAPKKLWAQWVCKKIDVHTECALRNQNLSKNLNLLKKT
jgi:hypothetical protein